MLSIKNKHIRDNEVTESENYAEDHIYLINKCNHKELGYESVTTFIKKFFESHF